MTDACRVDLPPSVAPPVAPPDRRPLRRALGGFATGVTIVTAIGRDGLPVGLTANSFNAVSLDPPLVLWSLARSSRVIEDFMAADHYAISVLCADQLTLARRFADMEADRFDGVAWRPGSTGVPLFEGCVAWFECASAHRYDGGDHVIFVGEVLAFDRAESVPLLFASGNFHVPTPHPEG